jgi:hypothetical protein
MTQVKNTASSPLPLDLKPMEAETTEELPSGEG